MDGTQSSITSIELYAGLGAGTAPLTALHSHMRDEQPRLFFMHFWANDDAIKLAMTLRTALGQMPMSKARTESHDELGRFRAAQHSTRGIS